MYVALQRYNVACVYLSTKDTLHSRKIGPWVRLILSIYAPGADVLARGGACFVRQVQSECLGVKW